MRATRWLAVRHLAFEDRSDQIVDVADRLDVTDWRQVRINSGRFDVLMTEVGLDLVQRHSHRCQMRGETVPQNVAGHLLGHANLLRRLAQMCAQAVCVHTLAGNCHVHCRTRKPQA